MLFQHYVKQRSSTSPTLILQTTMFKRATNFLPLLFLLLPSCAYRNNILYLFPDDNKQEVETFNNPDLFYGDIPALEMDEIDRSQLNRIFERTPSLRETSWHNNKSNKDHIIILQPAHPNLTDKRACRAAQIFLQDESNTGSSILITGCRENNGQWQLLKDQENNI